MGMVEAVTAFEAKLTETLTDLALPVPKFEFGEDRLMVEGKPPRITWVPTDGTVDAGVVKAPDARQVANPKDPAQAATAAVINPRPLWRRRPIIEAHVWAAGPDPANRRLDYKAAEDLANHLIAAIHETVYGGYVVMRESWRQGQTQASTTRKGIVCVVAIEVHFAFTRELDTTAVVTTMPITPVLQEIQQ